MLGPALWLGLRVKLWAGGVKLWAAPLMEQWDGLQPALPPYDAANF